MKKNEYEEIYGGETDEPAGFEFTYGKGHISKSKPISEDAVGKLHLEHANSDLIFVRCRTCGGYMEFNEGLNMFDSYWRCPQCGARVREATAYTQLERENAAFLRDMEDGK